MSAKKKTSLLGKYVRFIVFIGTFNGILVTVVSIIFSDLLLFFIAAAIIPFVSFSLTFFFS